jgi:outer membrane protein OmpA-like peptidoglycan-associated protein
MKRAWTLMPFVSLVAACAHTPPPELRDARASYDRAANGLAVQLAPADLHVAHDQLALAERSWKNDGDTRETRDLAYTAERKVRLAEVRARTVAIRQQQGEATTEADHMKDEKVRITSAQLDAAQRQLAVQDQALVSADQRTADAEQRARDAEKRAQQASTDLARIASVKQEPRGMVITLSGAVLFASGKYDLLAPAQAKLSEVASVLTKQDPDSKILVQGYTDSQGTESLNLELSRHRAESVRSYLVSHGIAADRVVAEGYGPAKPIADNASPEGRADNRRVEIVVQPK